MVEIHRSMHLIAEIIFTRDELVNEVFLDPASPRLTERTVMDDRKVYILKRMFYNFKKWTKKYSKEYFIIYRSYNVQI